MLISYTQLLPQNNGQPGNRKYSHTLKHGLHLNDVKKFSPHFTLNTMNLQNKCQQATAISGNNFSYSKSHMKSTNTLHGQTAGSSNVRVGDTFLWTFCSEESWHLVSLGEGLLVKCVHGFWNVILKYVVKERAEKDIHWLHLIPGRTTVTQ
jgi:hypothetical protein